MLHQTLPILGQLWQLFEVSQILEFLRYKLSNSHDDIVSHTAKEKDAMDGWLTSNFTSFSSVFQSYQDVGD